MSVSASVGVSHLECLSGIIIKAQSAPNCLNLSTSSLLTFFLFPVLLLMDDALKRRPGGYMGWRDCVSILVLMDADFSCRLPVTSCR